jgi:hypothetical protein
MPGLVANPQRLGTRGLERTDDQVFTAAALITKTTGQARHGTARGWGLTALPFSLSESINTNKQNVVDSTITALMYQKVSEKTSADLFAAVVWVVRDRNFQVDRTKN